MSTYILTVPAGLLGSATDWRFEDPSRRRAVLTRDKTLVKPLRSLGSLGSLPSLGAEAVGCEEPVMMPVVQYVMSPAFLDSWRSEFDFAGSLQLQSAVSSSNSGQ